MLNFNILSCMHNWGVFLENEVNYTKITCTGKILHKLESNNVTTLWSVCMERVLLEGLCLWSMIYLNNLNKLIRTRCGNIVCHTFFFFFL